MIFGSMSVIASWADLNRSSTSSAAVSGAAQAPASGGISTGPGATSTRSSYRKSGAGGSSALALCQIARPHNTIATSWAGPPTTIAAIAAASSVAACDWRASFAAETVTVTVVACGETGGG